MGIRFKFNLVLLIVFAAGIGTSAAVSYRLLHTNAKQEVLRNAGLMMEAALAIRAYTVKQVKPHLDEKLREQFLPQTVPAFAATETLNALRVTHPEFSYKEATLNPTNPRDRATEWEADVVYSFRNNAQLKELTGQRNTPSGAQLYLARPIQIKDPACLVCHSTPAAAPASMLQLYGESNGFGWNLMEIVGAQIVAVPMEVPIAEANRAFMTFMGSVAVIFAVTFVVLNIMLSVVIVRPIQELASAADQISTGNFDLPEFGEESADEIGALEASFNRMRRSIEQAIRLLDRPS
jgi:HAMP domain-containing protein